MLKKCNFYINGQWVHPVDGTDHLVIDPSTEEPTTTISLGGQTDVDNAVAAAKALKEQLLAEEAERAAERAADLARRTKQAQDARTEETPNISTALQRDTYR